MESGGAGEFTGANASAAGELFNLTWFHVVVRRSVGCFDSSSHRPLREEFLIDPLEVVEAGENRWGRRSQNSAPLGFHLATAEREREEREKEKKREYEKQLHGYK